jgi:CBS-domain-containing membrane protein
MAGDQVATVGPPHGRAITFPPLTVAHVMTRSVVSAYAGAVFKEIAAALDRNHINAVPVIDEEHRVVGLVTTSDLLTRIAHVRPMPRGHHVGARSDLARKEHGGTARELMTSPAITTTPGTSIADAAHQLARHRIRSMPVVDRDGRLIGIVSRADLIQLFLRSDDEIRDDAVRDVIQPLARPGDIDVTVREGVVRLTGHVGTALFARKLGFRVAGIAGVVDVHNELTFDVDDTFLPLSP